MIDDIRGDQPKEALLRGLYEMRGRIPLSFEVFPPKDSDGRTMLLIGSPESRVRDFR